ncbi:MAG: hypothetical protein NW200_09960 [Hyphomonadaceae bacterium]|nr:hypothetical protein [Hyphomonadaceae bacterium]
MTLVLLGAGAAACAPEPQYSRNVYASREDCYRDYGQDTRQCEPRGTQGFYGPFFWVGGGARPAGDPGPGASARGSGKSGLALEVSAPGRGPVARGGIGDTGRSGGHSASG